MRAQALIFALAVGLTLAGECAASCTVTSSGMSFGRIDPFATQPQRAVGLIIVQCDDATPRVTIRLHTANAKEDAHALVSGEHRLRYRLYQDANGHVPLGDDVPGSSGISVSLQEPGVPTRVPVYALIEPGQQPAPGLYSDQVTVSIDF